MVLYKVAGHPIKSVRNSLNSVFEIILCKTKKTLVAFS